MGDELPDLPLQPGRVLADRYTVKSVIVTGGGAAACDGFDRYLKRAVTLRVLPGLPRRDPVASEVIAEARAVAAISHPNVAAVYDVGEDRDCAFIVMERVDGETLASRTRRGALDPGSVVRIGAEILLGLEAAHTTGLLHGDITPGNILLAEDGAAKLANFGMAGTVRAPAGTPGYLAPERLRGEPASVAADIWSVGAVLHEALTGARPCRVGGRPVKAVAATGSHTEALADAGPTDRVASVIERAMSPAPEARFLDAGAMRAALLAADGAGVNARSPRPHDFPTLVMPAVPSTAEQAFDRTAVMAVTRPWSVPTRDRRRRRTVRRVVVPVIIALPLVGSGIVMSLPGRGMQPRAHRLRDAVTTTVPTRATATAVPPTTPSTSTLAVTTTSTAATSTTATSTTTSTTTTSTTLPPTTTTAPTPPTSTSTSTTAPPRPTTTTSPAVTTTVPSATTTTVGPAT